MKRKTFIFTIALTIAVTGAAASAGGGLTQFVTGGSIVQQDWGSRGSDSYMLNVPPGGNGTAGLLRKATSKQLLGRVDFSFVSFFSVAADTPRLSIPVNADTDAKTVEGYATLNPVGCGAPLGHSDAVTLVSTDNPACHVTFLNVTYPNWDAFVAAHPAYRMGKASTMVVADVNGNFGVEHVDLR